MAKKPTETTENQTEVAEDTPPPAPKSKKKLILLGAIGLAVLAGGGGYFALARKGASSEQSAPVKKPVAFLDIREMTVNLAAEPSEGRSRLLKFRVSLELKDQTVATEIQPLLPRVEDTFQVFVRELRASDLEGSAGLYRLREELLRRVNVAVFPAKVDAVLFKEIVVQ
jgi:flagellar FliL protein